MLEPDELFADEPVSELGEAAGAAALDLWIARRERQWEATVVRLVANGLGLDVPALRRLARERTGGDARLSLAALEELYPDLPCVLYARRVPHVHEIDLASLMMRFTRTTLFQTWEECLEQSPAGRAIAMVFPWPGLGTSVMHEQDPDLRSGGFSLMRVLEDGRKFVVDSLGRFLSRLLERWRDDS